MRLDQAVKDRDMEIAQDIIRLRFFGFMVTAGKDPDLFSRFTEIFDSTPGGGRKTVTGGVEVVDDEKDFHSAGKVTKLFRLCRIRASGRA